VVEIIVADTGAAWRTMCFGKRSTPISRRSSVGQGSGLGPGQVQQFVQESGGAIGIKSEVGVGTAVRMPVSRPAEGNSVDLPNSIATF
jgi:two-component system cell cycle sensor histidine kinase/response regulator CckA